MLPVPSVLRRFTVSLPVLHEIQIDQHEPQAEEMAAAIEQCIHCGFCLPTCPTHVVLGEEMDSPRGRIFLMKGVLEGSLDVAVVAPFIDCCGGCGASSFCCHGECGNRPGCKFGRLYFNCGCDFDPSCACNCFPCQARVRIASGTHLPGGGASSSERRASSQEW